MMKELSKPLSSMPINKLVMPDRSMLFCSFRTDGQLYGIDAAHVREVSTQTSCTPVPQAPSSVRGLTNLRSRVLLVIDIRPLLGLDPVENTTDSRLIVLKPHLAEDVGILVECGGDIVNVAGEQIESRSTTPDESGKGATRSLRVIAGVCKLDNELMTLIDTPGVIESVRSSTQ